MVEWKDLIPATLGGAPNNIFNHAITGSKWDRYMGTHQPLWDHVAENGPEKIMEVGLGCGLNAKVMRGLTQADIYIFDNLSYSEAKSQYEYLKNLKGFNFIIGDTRETLPPFELKGIDLIVIDGGHSYEVCKSDWENTKKLMTENTVVFFHDYHMTGVNKTVGEISEDYSIKIVKSEIGPPWAKVRKRNIQTERDVREVRNNER